jgi:hypothetical protein
MDLMDEINRNDSFLLHNNGMQMMTDPIMLLFDVLILYKAGCGIVVL